MKQDTFINHREPVWREFEQQLHAGDAFKGSFGALFREICADLGKARARNYSPMLVNRLNDLVTRGQAVFYRDKRAALVRLAGLVRREFPLALHDNRYFIGFAIAAFFGIGLLSYLLAYYVPATVDVVFDPSTLEDIGDMYNPAGPVQDGMRDRSDDILMFGIYIYNNISIAFQMFAGGVLFCAGALFYLIFNGVYFGMISAYIVMQGYSEPFFSFVIGHGSFELTALVIAGAAGCRLGYALLRPGHLTRFSAFQRAGKSAMPLIAGAFVMLVVAAGIEAFWSPREIDATIKYIAGSALWGFVLYRLVRGCVYGT